MSSDLPDPAPRECDRHEWHDVAEIGGWLQGTGGGRLSERPVREIAADDSIWTPDRRDPEVTREALTAGILAASGITCEHALKATTYLDGCIGLNNGVHRWAVAAELGIERVPVEMHREAAVPAWAYDESWALPGRLD